MATSKRRWFRFSLRAFLCVITLICFWFGYYASQVSDRRQALEYVKQLGCATWQQGQMPNTATVTTKSAWTNLSERYDELVFRVFGDVLRRNMVAIDLSTSTDPAVDLSRLRPLGEVEWLTLAGTGFDDTSAAHLRHFERLRWLDVSNSAISMTGIRKLDNLDSLEWLNVAGTAVVESDLETIRSMFPGVEIGYASDPASSGAHSTALGQQDLGANSDQLWSAVLADPYSDEALTNYLSAIGRSSAVDFSQWYISAVYRAKRKAMAPVLVVEVYNGRRGSFNLGCLLVFGPNGNLLREIADERVHWSLSGPSTQVNWRDAQVARVRSDQRAAALGQVLELSDLTGDGFDEIPTQRWNHSVGSINVGGEWTTIYTTSSKDIPSLLCIGFPNRDFRKHLVDLSGIHLSLAYRISDSGELVLETPCYSATPTGTAILDELPQRTLATFRWSEEAGTYLGPTRGPQDTWTVIQRH